jgi:hypothetical protein
MIIKHTYTQSRGGSRIWKKSFTSGSYILTKTVNNYPTKLRLKLKFFWSDKNGVVGSKLSVIPQTPRA